MVGQASLALWVIGITQAPPPLHGIISWEESQFSPLSIPKSVPKCPIVPVAATSPHMWRYELLHAKDVNEMSKRTKLEAFRLSAWTITPYYNKYIHK